MNETTSFKRLILRAVLRQVSTDGDPPSLGLRSGRSPTIPRNLQCHSRVERRSGLPLLMSTARSSTASVAKRDPKPYTNSSCTGGKSSSTSATRCICGSGMFESWILRTVLKPTMCPFGSRRGPRSATTNWGRSSVTGIRGSDLKPLSPRLLDAL